MTRILATALVLAAAAPAAASDQLARSLGVAPGQYSLAQLVALKNAATQDGNEAFVNLDNLGQVGRPIAE